SSCAATARPPSRHRSRPGGAAPAAVAGRVARPRRGRRATRGSPRTNRPSCPSAIPSLYLIVDAVMGTNDSGQDTPAMPVSEPELLEQAKTGDLEAFAEFVRVFERRVRAVCYRLLDDTRDVDEAVQDTFVQAWRSLERFRGDAAPYTWLYRIAVNEALMRRRRKTLPTSELPEAAGSGGEGEDAARDARAFLIQRLRALPDEYRTAVVLRDLEGFSNEEVAQMLEISLAAAKSRIHRGRMRLREELERWERGEALRPSD